jgi:hypothetical protein
MVIDLFSQFLLDPEQYKLSERHWEGLWNRIDSLDRDRFVWTPDWLGTGSLNIKDGNPIFSAYSPVLRRGIRVIQEEPIKPGLDIQAWLDTFGGDIMSPDHTDELVISCVLSDVASEIARSLMTPWVRGHSISFRSDEARLLLPSGLRKPKGRARPSGLAA